MDRKGSQQHLEKVKNYWNNLADLWDESAQTRFSLNQKWEEWSPTLHPYLPKPHPSIKVLDAGCGVGQMCSLFSHFGYSVTACDLSAGMLGFARKQADNLNLPTQIEFTISSIDQLPFVDNHFDLVVSRLVLDFTPRPGYTLKELRRVTKNGGKLLLYSLGANSPVVHDRWKRFVKGIDPGAAQYTEVFNGITPWEVESILPVLGWKLLQHEGLYNQTVSGSQNQFNKEKLEMQPILLQQVAASIWQIVAEAVEPQPL